MFLNSRTSCSRHLLAGRLFTTRVSDNAQLYYLPVFEVLDSRVKKMSMRPYFQRIRLYIAYPRVASEISMAMVQLGSKSLSSKPIDQHNTGSDTSETNGSMIEKCLRRRRAVSLRRACPAGFVRRQSLALPATILPTICRVLGAPASTGCIQPGGGE
ncbi:hypothetical protein BBP40_001296 [Aspergillus hancockii]|nr:hypothetical protein BBP40_001296 [Aspergillus hancockii]